MALWWKVLSILSFAITDHIIVGRDYEAISDVGEAIQAAMNAVNVWHLLHRYDYSMMALARLIN